MITKYVESNHYHLWTDVLHARELSKQTDNKLDRGSYIRWAIITAWIALEMACQDALDDKDISYRFKENMDTAINKKNLTALDWGQGVWQKVSKVNELRKSAVHRFASEKELFPELVIADYSIETVREAIKTIYEHCSKPVPEWIKDDIDKGWTTGRVGLSGIIINSPYMGVNGAIKVTFVLKGEEFTWDYLSPDTDINQPIEYYYNAGEPITAVRLYRGDEVIVEFEVDSSKIRS